MSDPEPVPVVCDPPVTVEPPPYPPAGTPVSDNPVMEGGVLPPLPPAPPPEPIEVVEPAPADYERAVPARYAIGTPGQHPRMLATVPYAREAQGQVRDGEVCLPANTLPGEPYRIKVDGSGLESIDVPFEEMKARAWAAAKAYRDWLQSSTCPTTAGTVQIDETSRGFISASAVAAKITKDAGAPFSVDFTMADNTVVTLDADQMIQMAFEVMAYFVACQNAGTAIRETIEAAEDATALALIDIKAGYPS